MAFPTARQAKKNEFKKYPDFYYPKGNEVIGRLRRSWTYIDLFSKDEGPSKQAIGKPK